MKKSDSGQSVNPGRIFTKLEEPMDDFQKDLINDLKNLNLNHLLYFHATAKAGSLTDAAKQLHLSQPTLSQQIMKLESSLHTSLFSRESRSIKLSENGRFLLNFTNKIFDLAEEMLANFNYQKYNSHNKLTRVGFSQTAPRLVLTKLVAPLFEHPDFGIQIVEESFDSLLEKLKMQELDFIIAEDGSNRNNLIKDIKVRPIYRPQYHIVASEKSEFKNTGQSLNQIVNHSSYIKFPSRNPLQRKIDRFFLQKDLHPNVSGECQDMQTACTFITQSNSFAILPKIIFSTYPGLVSLYELNEIESLNLSAFYLANFDNNSVEELVEKISRF